MNHPRAPHLIHIILLEKGTSRLVCKLLPDTLLFCSEDYACVPKFLINFSKMFLEGKTFCEYVEGKHETWESTLLSRFSEEYATDLLNLLSKPLSVECFHRMANFRVFEVSLLSFQIYPLMACWTLVGTWIRWQAGRKYFIKTSNLAVGFP